MNKKYKVKYNIIKYKYAFILFYSKFKNYIVYIVQLYS